MGKVTSEQKAKFQNNIKDFKKQIDEIKALISLIQHDIKIKNDGNNNYRRIIVANEYLKIISLYCNMSDVSMELLQIRNENYLNEARKLIYQVLILLEEVVSPHIDIPLTEMEESLASIVKVNPSRKLALIRKIGYNITQIKDGFGENTKWKWSFVEIEGRYAAVIKNLIDYKACQANNDPRNPFYVEMKNLLKIAKEQLEHASKRYREKYELTSQEVDDIKKSIDFLHALRRINVMFNEPEDAQNQKRMIELYTKQMETNMKKKERDKNRPAAKGKPRR